MKTITTRLVTQLALCIPQKKEIEIMKRVVMRRIGMLVSAAFVLLPVLPTYALAQAFVTGSANVAGFSIVGLVQDQGDGTGTGHFTIVVHRDVPEGDVAAVKCSYRNFDDLVIIGNTATFHSVGACRVLTTLGATRMFSSDNVFAIIDNGEPGAAIDVIDVNFLGASGISIPGGFLVDGNFIVSGVDVR